VPGILKILAAGLKANHVVIRRQDFLFEGPYVFLCRLKKSEDGDSVSGIRGNPGLAIHCKILAAYQRSLVLDLLPQAMHAMPCLLISDSG
jgi:hypothetical protein